MLLNEYVTEYREQLQHRLDNPVYFSGLPMFHPDLDKAIRGLRPQEVTFLAGGTATGKSSVALRTVAYNMLYNKVDYNNEVIVYVTAEMPNRKVVNRLISLLTGVPGILLDTGALQDEIPCWFVEGRKVSERFLSVDKGITKISKAIRDISNWPLDLRDMSLPTTMQIQTWIKSHVESGLSVPLVVIDHIGKISDAPPTDSSVMVHQHKLNSIMALAKEFNTHVLVIHDLDKVGTQKSLPNATNMKGGSASQYDPDNVVLIISEDGRKGEKYVFFHLEKNRHGAGYTGKFGPVMFAQPAGLFGIDIENSDIWRKYNNG